MPKTPPNYITKKEFSESMSELLNVIDRNHNEVKQEIKEQTSHLPTKEEFYSKSDEIMKEVRDSRDEQDALSHRSSNHEDRITTLENKVGIAPN